jgi:tetratricopeptide (TPR) repeat protein
MLGKTYFMLGDLGKSISELEAALKLAPDDVDVVYTLGIAYLRNRQSAEARRLYESMIKQFGDRPQLHIIIGRAYRQSGLMGEAADEFKKAIALDNHFPRAHYYLGITYLLDEGQTKVNEALAEFQIELAANPDEFFANYYLGIVYIFQRKWDLAVRFLQKASTIEPNNPDPYFQLGQAYQELNQHERVIEVLKKSIALNPNLAHNKNQVTKAHLILAQALLRTGQTAAGQKELQIAADLKLQAFKLEQQTPGSKPATDPGGLAAQDTLLSEAGFEPRVDSKSPERDEKTIEELKSGATYYEQVLATAHNNVGMLRGERQDFTSAAEQFALAVKWNPNQEGLNYNLGLAYYKSGLFEKSIPPLEIELKTHPENRSAAILLGTSYFRLGQALLQRGDLSGAIHNLESAAKFAPEDPDVHYHLGQAYLAAGRKTEGRSQIDIANQLKIKTSKSDNK